MILYFYGADTFRSRQHLRQSIDQFKKQRDPQGYNTVVVDGKKVELSKFNAEIMATPFLAEKRMVVVENILSSSNKELLADIVKRVAENKVPANTVVIFWQAEPLSKVKEAKELQTLLSKEKFAQEFAPLGPKLGAWIQKEAEARGGAIEASAVEFLVRNAGHDMWQLNTVIDQLIAYVHGRDSINRVSTTDVQLFLDEKIDDNVFGMIEAMVSGNKKTAFKLLEEQRRLGEEDGKIFGLFIWQFKILLQIADILAREPHLTSDIVAKELGIHPFVAKKNFAVAKRYSLAQLEKIYHTLLRIDTKTKTGQAGQGLLLDIFVASM